MTEQSDLDILFPGEDVMVRGEKIRVLPFNTGQYAKASKIIKEIAPTLIEQAGSLDKAIDITMLMVDCADPMLDLIAIAVNKPRAWVDGTAPEEALELAAAVFAQNKEEFSKKVMPRLAAIFRAAKAKEAPVVDLDSSSRS